MTCLICGEPAVSVNADDYLERVCLKCGQYRVTGAALVLMKTYNWRFDLELVRRWISESQEAGLIPTIDSHQAACLIDV